MIWDYWVSKKFWHFWHEKFANLNDCDGVVGWGHGEQEQLERDFPPWSQVKLSAMLFFLALRCSTVAGIRERRKWAARAVLGFCCRNRAISLCHSTTVADSSSWSNSSSSSNSSRSNNSSSSNNSNSSNNNNVSNTIFFLKKATFCHKQNYQLHKRQQQHLELLLLLHLNRSYYSSRSNSTVAAK